MHSKTSIIPRLPTFDTSLSKGSVSPQSLHPIAAPPCSFQDWLWLTPASAKVCVHPFTRVSRSQPLSLSCRLNSPVVLPAPPGRFPNCPRLAEALAEASAEAVNPLLQAAPRSEQLRQQLPLIASLVVQAREACLAWRWGSGGRLHPSCLTWKPRLLIRYLCSTPLPPLPCTQLCIDSTPLLHFRTTQLCIGLCSHSLLSVSRAPTSSGHLGEAVPAHQHMLCGQRCSLPAVLHLMRASVCMWCSPLQWQRRQLEYSSCRLRQLPGRYLSHAWSRSRACSAR